MTKQITPTMQRTLIKMHEMRTQFGYMPNSRELADELNYSCSAIQMQLASLVHQGYLIKQEPVNQRSASRSIQFGKKIGNSIPVLGVCS